MRGRWPVLLALLTPHLAAAGTPTLEDIIAAHGGAERLAALGTYAARLSLTDIWVRQSPQPGPPWHTSEGVQCVAFVLDGDRHARYVRRMGAGFYPFHSLLWTGDEASWRFNLYDGWKVRSRTADPSGARDRDLRFAPTPLVATLARHRDRVTALGTETGPDAPRALFRYEPASGEPMSLAFDARTRMLRSLQWGGETVRFDGYEMVGGLPVSRRMAMDWRGDTVWRLHLDAAAFGRPMPTLPDAAPALPEIEAPDTEDARRFRVRTLGPGIHFIGEGATYQLFVEFRDFVAALGAVGGVGKRLETLRPLTGGKPLRYALVTHHHADHLAGVPALVDAGAVLVASPAHEAAIREAAGPGRTPRFAFVTNRRTVTDGSRSLVFQALGPMRHAEHMLAAWVPEEQLLFSADLFVQPPARPVRAANPPIRELLSAIDRLELDVTRLVDTHSPVVSNLADLRLAAGREGNFTAGGPVERAICPP